MTNLDPKLKEWDRNILSPIVDTAKAIIKKGAGDAILKPAIQLVSEILGEVATGAGTVASAGAKAIWQVIETNRDQKARSQINSKLRDGIVKLTHLIVDRVGDQNTPLSLESIRDIYSRVRLLHAIGNANDIQMQELKNLDQNLNALLEQSGVSPKQLNGSR